MRKLRQQLLLSYVPLILVPILLVGLATRHAAEHGMTLFVTQAEQQQAQALAHCISTYYEEHGSWNGFFDHSPAQVFVWMPTSDTRIIFVHGGLVAANRDCYPSEPMTQFAAQNDPLTGSNADQVAIKPGIEAPNLTSTDNPWEVTKPRAFPMFFRGNLLTMTNFMLKDIRNKFGPGRILITDENGTVLTADNRANIGQTLSPQTLAQGAPIVANGKTVGILVVAPELPEPPQSQRESVGAVNLALFASAGVSFLLAVGLGWWFSWRTTIPVQQLMMGVRRLAAGRWAGPLEVRAQNEFGDLTRAFNSMAGEITHQQQLNRQMVADIAHDLRTPLSAMALEVEAIEAGFQTPADATTSLREEITWLQHLVDDLRLLSLMDADQIHLQLEETPLCPFLEGILDFWQTMADDQGRCLQLQICPGLATVCIDPNRMRQAIGNLIDNAIRHTRPGHQIILGARANEGHVLIWVSDEGDGISPEALPHIFDRFYRSDPSRTHSDKGSGLGLSITNRLVEMHHGTIRVTSVVGHGSTFTISLPHGR